MTQNIGAQQMCRIMSRIRHKQQMRDLDAFAELLAEEVEVAEAARIMGRSESWGRMALCRIRRQLGPWAV